jgi:hypothetical protein
VDTVTPPALRPPLTRADRCDRCSAAARVRAVLRGGELLFCGHHARAHRAPLLAAGARLVEDA